MEANILWTGILSVLIPYFNTVSGTPVCVYKNRFYISDTEIYDGNCNVAYCDKIANLVYKQGCSSSTESPVTPPQRRQMVTTVPYDTTTDFGCHVHGKVYPAGTDISRHEDRSSNWCYGTFCDQSGHTVHWDNFNCFPTTATTVPTMLPTLLSGRGCYYNGKFYPANTNLGAPDERATKYCTRCDENGQIQHWYDYDCYRTETTTPWFTAPNVVG